MTWLLQWLVQGSAVALVATLAARLVPPASPRARHLFWWAALVGVLALPSLSQPPEPHIIAAGVNGDVPHRFALEVPTPPDWLWPTLIGLWGWTAWASLETLFLDLRAVRRLVRRSQPMTDSNRPDAVALVAMVAAVRGATLAVSDDLHGACAVGFRTPRVLVSSRLISALTREELESVVRHELAHLERFDDGWCLVQRVVLAVAGLHPAVRWISRQIDAEREAACDRLVVERTGAPMAYARALTAAAEALAGSQARVPAVVPGASVGEGALHARVTRLLESRPARRRTTWAAASASAASLGFAVAAASGLPPLVVVTLPTPLSVPLSHLPEGRALVANLPRVSSQPVSTLVGRSPGDAGYTERMAPTSMVARPLREPAPAIDLGGSAVRHGAGAGPVQQHNDPVLEIPAARQARLLQWPQPNGADGATRVIGAGAARFGSVAGEAAARAGSAVGRFFAKGGQSVAAGF